MARGRAAIRACAHTARSGFEQPKDDDRSKTPNDGPSRSSDRTAILKAVARRIVQTGETVATFAKLSRWVLTYSATIETYNDRPRSLEELQRAVSTPAPGYDIHHIVEQYQKGVFAEDDIDGLVIWSKSQE
jgi:hypothetical protein